MRSSEQIAADETGWRIGGHPARVHAWVGDRATGYAIDSTRSADALERVIGVGWSGILSHDGFASYERFEAAIHRQCVARSAALPRPAGHRHAWSRPFSTPVGRAVHRGHPLAQRVRAGCVDRQPTSTRIGWRSTIARWNLVCRPRAVPEYATLARHLWNHFEQWFASVFDPRIEPTNWKAEQAIRPAVVNRKVWGGKPDSSGARGAGRVDVGVFETCRRQTLSVVDHVGRTLRWFGNRLLPRPVRLGQ